MEPCRRRGRRPTIPSVVGLGERARRRRQSLGVRADGRNCQDVGNEHELSLVRVQIIDDGNVDSCSWTLDRVREIGIEIGEKAAALARGHHRRRGGECAGPPDSRSRPLSSTPLGLVRRGPDQPLHQRLLRLRPSPALTAMPGLDVLSVGRASGTTDRVVRFPPRSPCNL
jgi:hypothetical protein